MRTLTASAVALLLLAAASANAAITGTVIDSSGAPLAGVTVRAFAIEPVRDRDARLIAGTLDREPLASAQTSENGSFRLDKFNAATVDLVASAAGRESVTRFTADGDDTVVMLRDLKPRKLRVVANGKPVANAIVGVSRGVALRTANDGTFELPAANVRSVTIYHRDYAPAEVSVNRNDSDLKIDGGVAISGRVMGADDKPVAGATITINQWPLAKSGDDGTFAIAHAPRAWREMYAATADRLAVASRSNTSSYTMKLRPAVQVSGTVRDEKSRAPVAGMLLRLPFGEVLTDAKGNFAFPPAAAGRYPFFAAHPGYAIANMNALTIPAEGSKQSLAATAFPVLSGTVIDEERKPVGGAFVSRGMAFPGGDGAATYTRRDGSFTLRTPSMEPYRVFPFEVSKDGYADAQFSATEGQSKSGISVVMKRGVPLAITVVDTNKVPVASSYVRITPTERDSPIPREVRCNGSDCITGTDGKLTVRVAPAKYDISVWSANAVTKQLPAQVVDARTAPLTITVERGVDVSGRVTYSDGTPLTSAVRVMLESTGAMPMANLTEADGTFVFHNAVRGTVTLRPEIFELTRYIGPPKEVQAPAANVVLTIPRGGHITGRVLDASSSAPITDFELMVQRSVQGPAGGAPRSIHSDDGSFTLDDVTAGRVEVTAVAPGYTRGAATGIELAEGGSVANVDIRLEKAARVRGRVTSNDGQALSGVRVTPIDPGRRFGMADFAMTDADGNYELTSVAAGERNVAFAKEGYVNATKSVEATVGRDARLDVVLDKGRDLAGRVVDESGQPVMGADVRVEGEPMRPVQTETDGTFRLSGLREGRVRVVARKSGYVDASSEADTAAPANLTLTLGRGASVSGHITGLTDAEMSMATVSYFGQGGYGNTRPDASGNFTLTGVRDGKVTIEANTGMQNRRGARKMIEVVNGSAPMVELAFTAGSTVRGRVAAAGRSLSDFNISFAPIDGSLAPGGGRLDSDGNYSVSGLGSGDYRVVIMAPMVGVVHTEKYTVSGDSTHDINLQSAALRGRVTDTDGQPLANARVSADVVKREAGSPMPRGTTTDSDGRYLLDFVAPGDWRVSVQKEKYQPASKETMIGDSTPPLDFQLSNAAKSTVRVVDSRDGSPVLAMVNVVQSGRSAYSAQTSAGDGVADLYLAPGHYTIHVSAQRYARSTTEIDVPGPEVRVTLSPGGTIVIVAKPGSRVRLATGPGGPMLFTGNNRFDNVAPGHYTAQLLGADNKVAQSKPVDVIEGQTATVTFE